MANLIPTEAKKTIVTEYWLRVVVTWAYLIGTGLLIVALLKAPALWAIESQLQAYSGAYDSAQEKVETIKTSQITIEEANDLAALLANSASTTSSVAVLETLDTIAGTDVIISGFRLSKDDKKVININITGVAKTRTALADFRTNIEAHEYFKKADLPISNLAKESDIAFNIDITPGNL